MGTCMHIQSEQMIIRHQICMENGKKIDNYLIEDNSNEKKQKQANKWRFLCCDQQQHFCSPYEEICHSEIDIKSDLKDDQSKINGRMECLSFSKICSLEEIETSIDIEKPFKSKMFEKIKVKKQKIMNDTLQPRNFIKNVSIQKPRQKMNDFYSEDLDIRRTFVTQKQISESLQQKKYQGTLSVISQIESIGSTRFEKPSQNDTRRVNKSMSMQLAQYQISQ